jgi:hypothetical protein
MQTIHQGSTTQSDHAVAHTIEAKQLHPVRRLLLLFNRKWSRSLSELTRQITPPTKNGHAPPPIEIKKELSICQSLLCLDLVSFPVLSQIKPQAPLLVCPSVNSFKFQPCDHTPPRTQRLVVSRKSLRRSYDKRNPIIGPHCLRLRLRRYLIVFDPLTFVLDQWKHPC